MKRLTYFVIVAASRPTLLIASTLALMFSAARAATAPTGPFNMEAVRADAPPPLVASIASPQWSKAHGVPLDWDFTFHRAAREQTTAYLLYDDRYVYVACVAKQKDPVVATQHTNDVGDDLDDNFAVQFWPSGATGIRYKFTATALGTRYEESSENDNYAPQWDAAGHIGDGGFVIVIRVPLNIMRGDGRTEWRVQFQRLRRTTGELYMWATDPAATEDDQGQFAGYLHGMIGIASSTRTKPRLSLYELAALGSAAAGGSTSRIGADLAVPITATTSILATAHPDYSNVELDQQAIQPSEFPRVLQEIRPFFAQGASYYNKFDQIGNTNNIMLNTPSIATPRVGTAIEGHEGHADFAAFDSVGFGNTHTAEALFFTTPDKRLVTGYQRVAVSELGLANAQTSTCAKNSPTPIPCYDLAQAATAHYDNQHDFFAYATYGDDRGTNAIKPEFGGWEEAGMALYSPVSRLAFALKRIGKYYSPADGLVDHSNTAGYAVEGTRHFDFSNGAWLKFIEVTSDVERYHNATLHHPRSGLLNQGDNDLDVILSGRNLFTLETSTGSHYLVDPTDPMGAGDLFNENVASLGYNVDGATPTILRYTYGRFSSGFLRTWSRTTTLHATERGFIDVELDTSRYSPDGALPGAQLLTQNLARIGFTYQFTSNDSFTAGVRRVTGAPFGIGAGIDIPAGTNVSLALHHRRPQSELYFVYGDPNADTTYPVLTIKLIEYIGAEKGS